MKRWTSPEMPIMAGPSERISYFIEPVQNHQEHEINIALRGEGLYYFDGGRTLPLSAGEILILPAGLMHGIEVPHGLSMRMFHLHASIFNRLGDLGDDEPLREQLTGWDHPLPARKVVMPEVFQTLLDLYEQTAAELAGRDVHSPAVLVRLCELVAFEFLRIFKAAESGEPPDSAARRALTVKAWIDRHFAEPCSLGDLAAMAHFSPSHFSAVFAETVGTAPMAYVKSRRLEQARLLLARTDRPVQEIARSVGFRQAGHFNHVFKASTGLSPLAYRKKSQADSVPD